MIVGAATSSLHSEGAAPASDWAGWEAAGWVPPSGDGNGFATRYADDAALLADHGLGALRLALEWARLEPQPSDRGLDTGEVDRYRRILRAVRDAGLQAWACLAHTTLPGWFSEDERGFLDERMARRVWPRHVDRVAEAFGDLVDGWITFHEPVRHALDAWLLRRLPPGRTDGDDARSGLQRLLAADAEAARLLHVPGGAPVASCHWLPSLHALDTTPECREATAAADRLIWGSWREHISHDLFGVSCAYGLDVGPDGSFHIRPDSAHDVAEALHRIADEVPGRPVVLLTSAPGGSDAGATDDDDRRHDTTRDIDAAIAEAVADGIDVREVHWWSAVDGYEGWAGFTQRSGLFDRDRNPATVNALSIRP